MTFKHKIFHILGLTVLLTDALFFAFDFFIFAVLRGSVTNYEHNLFVAYPEFAMSIFGAVYAIYLISVARNII